MMQVAGLKMPLEILDTVNKERSSMQYQVDKINKPDVSAKDAIFSNKVKVAYKSIKTEQSDHNMVQYIKE